MNDEIKVLVFLENCIGDPMWPSHFEMHKDKAQEIISIIQKLRAQNYALQDEKEKLHGVPQEQLACDCGAPTEGEWADKHTVGCASLNMTCPFCGGPSGNIAAEYVTCGAAWNPDCPGHQVKAPTDANNCRVSTLWNTRP